MPAKDFKRKLTAIFSADVAGYSRLMAEDESATVKLLETYREVMSALIIQYRGRVIDSPGDNLLAEFSSVVDGVQCAVAVQKEFQARNGELPENRRMEFRIGINLGDVIEEGERIYGDGVNIAARVEGLAKGGGICISGTAFDQVKNKISVGYEYRGKQSVKNIPGPIRVYKVLMEPEAVGKVIGEEEPRPRKKRWTVVAAVAVLAVVVVAAWGIWNFYFRPPAIESGSVKKMAYPLPYKPSIAVLPFTNLSGDPKENYFSDGLTEEIITALSKTPKLLVIARTSSFKYKGKEVDVRTVGRELGVRYVLEGSVRKAGNTVRITAQLVDANTGNDVWAERYDRELKDIFAIQDEITMKVVIAMRVNLTVGEQARLLGKSTKNLEAYLKFLEGLEQLLRYNKEANARAKQLLEEAITLDPEFGLAYSLLGRCHWSDAAFGWSGSPSKSLQKAFKLAQKALSLDDSLCDPHSLLGSIYILRGQREKAIDEGERAVELCPNGAFQISNLGWILKCAGKPEEAIPIMKKAIRLEPTPPVVMYDILGRAFFLTGRYEEAIAEYKKGLRADPDYLDVHIGLASTYSVLGRKEEARAEAAEILRINPNFSIERYAHRMQFQVGLEPEIKGLRKAGLK